MNPFEPSLATWELKRETPQHSVGVARTHGNLRRAFWPAVIGFCLLVGTTASPPNAECGIGGAAIIFAALIPSAVWMRRSNRFPLFPIFAASHIGTFAFPLLYAHPVVLAFPPERQLGGGLTVAGFLLLATFSWYQVWKRPVKPVQRCLLLTGDRADTFFLLALVGGIFVTVATTGNWLQLPEGVFSALRAISLALNALAAFALSHRSGEGSLRPQKQIIFRVVLVLLILSTLPGLLLVNAMSILVVAALGYTLGANRLPWRMALLTMGLFALLQAGKGDMRNLYWGDAEDRVIQPAEYPSFLAQWAKTSVNNMIAGETETGEESQSLIERASLMQLLLYEQSTTPGDLPFLMGDTYSIIPELLIPRIFYPNKPASHEGTYRLNIHYGFQTREATETTTIGFGLLNEAFANFGYFGVGGLAILLGLYYAAVSRWAENTPVLSFRSLFAIIVASYSFQSEFASGVYVSALFQSTIALCGLALLLMRTGPCESAPSLPFASSR